MDDVAWTQRYTTYPVLEQGHPIGLLAFRSVASVPRHEWNTRRVRDAMIPRTQVPELDEDEPAIDALAELSTSEVNRGFVLDNGRLAGFLSITDLARALKWGGRLGPIGRGRLSSARRRRRRHGTPTPSSGAGAGGKATRPTRPQPHHFPPRAREGAPPARRPRGLTCQRCVAAAFPRPPSVT